MTGTVVHNPWLKKIASLLHALPRDVYRRHNQLAIDGVLCSLSLWVAFNLRFDFHVPVSSRPPMYLWMLLLPLLRPATMLMLGAYKGIWRYFNLYDALMVIATAAPSTAAMLVLRGTLGERFWPAAIPYTVCVIELGVYVALAFSIRSFRRATYEIGRGIPHRKLRALIVGAEETLAGAIRQASSDPRIHVVGVLAPQEQMHGLRIGGFDVLTGPGQLGPVLAKKNIDVVLIADAGMQALGHTVATATEFGVDIRLLPSASSVVSGEVRVAAPPKAEIALMERGVALASTAAEVEEAFRLRTVLVSGAGGSIGSEICRQAVQLPVRKIILLDQDENAIFERNNELRAMAGGVEIVPLVGDIRDEARLRRVFTQHSPQIVLHAAAYKHVPVMEANCSEAILNNITGTRLLAETAASFACERFLMISTDKAVNPISVMGASKRVAELIVQGLAAREAERNGTTRFACVRFGNVAGSRGSVVPIFLRQIAAGEPLTITDEAMTRYFMTIPEAVQLVLQACSLGDQGDIYILDMGDPIKIKNLACKLIEMSGLRPGKDIEIQVIGMRPGEKLHEELWYRGATVEPTHFSRVFRIAADGPPARFEQALRELEQQAREGRDAEARQLLFKMPLHPQRAGAAAATASRS